MQQYQATSQAADKDERPQLISVRSKLCLYTVWLDEDYTRLVGPGVDETDESAMLPEFDSIEDTAIYIVMLFESGLFPTEEF